jgi:hypothetical protein
MHQLQDHAFAVDISPKAWSQKGALPREVFEQIEGRLRSIAAWASEVADQLVLMNENPVGCSFSMNLADYTAIYSIACESRLVTLQEVILRDVAGA